MSGIILAIINQENNDENNDENNIQIISSLISNSNYYIDPTSDDLPPAFCIPKLERQNAIIISQ